MMLKGGGGVGVPFNWKGQVGDDDDDDGRDRGGLFASIEYCVPKRENCLMLIDREWDKNERGNEQ